MDAFKGIVDFAKQQLDCIECQKQQKILNADISKLKNFVNRYKPNAMKYLKNRDGYEQFQKDFKEWDDLMRL